MTKAQVAKLKPGTEVWCMTSPGSDAEGPFGGVFRRTFTPSPGAELEGRL